MLQKTCGRLVSENIKCAILVLISWFSGDRLLVLRPGVHARSHPQKPPCSSTPMRNDQNMSLLHGITVFDHSLSQQHRSPTRNRARCGAPSARGAFSCITPPFHLPPRFALAAWRRRRRRTHVHVLVSRARVPACGASAPRCCVCALRDGLDHGSWIRAVASEGHERDTRDIERITVFD